MSNSITSEINTKLSKQTCFFGLQVWVVILACIAIVLALVFLLFLSVTIHSFRLKFSRNNRSKSKPVNHTSSTLGTMLVPQDVSDIEMKAPLDNQQQRSSCVRRNCDYSAGSSRASSRLDYQFTFKEIETATNGFSDGNVIGSGDYGIVFRGILVDNTLVAVKKLWSYRCEAEDFRQNLEAIGNVRHKNLVKLLGCCIEGSHRMLVYDYIDNNSLRHWLHDYVRDVSPLTWSMRMKIISGVAKGLAYLHQDVEPSIVPQSIKSSNVLLDRQWNACLSDVGMARLVYSDESHPVSRSMTPSGYVEPGNISLPKEGGVYSLGILIMEIVSGRTPIDYNRPKHEIFLIDWLKDMVANQKSDRVVDPKIIEKPVSKALKRILLVALRCVDADLTSRPKMGDVIYMLDKHELLLTDCQMARRRGSVLSEIRIDENVID